MKTVVKFGGSSLASAEQFKKVGEIIRKDPARRFVVPSAPGKRFDKDTKVTDMLYGVYHLAERDEDFTDQLKAIKERYYEIIRGLSLELSIEKEFAEIEENFRNHAGEEYAASRGEFLNGKVMASYLGFPFVDAAEIIVFDEDGTLNIEKTDVRMKNRLCDMDDVARLVQDGVDEFGIAREYVVGQLGELVVHAETTAHGEDEGGERDYGEGGKIAQCNTLESHPLLSEGVESDADELDETDYPAPDAGQAFRVQLP